MSEAASSYAGRSTAADIASNWTIDQTRQLIRKQETLMKNYPYPVPSNLSGKNIYSKTWTAAQKKQTREWTRKYAEDEQNWELFERVLYETLAGCLPPDAVSDDLETILIAVEGTRFDIDDIDTTATGFPVEERTVNENNGWVQPPVPAEAK